MNFTVCKIYLNFFNKVKKVNGCCSAYKIPTYFKTLKRMCEYKLLMKARKKTHGNGKLKFSH